MEITEVFYVGGTYGPTFTIVGDNGEPVYVKGDQRIHASLNHIQEDKYGKILPYHPEADWYLAIWTEEEGMLRTVALKSKEDTGSNLVETIEEAKETIKQVNLDSYFQNKIWNLKKQEAYAEVIKGIIRGQFPTANRIVYDVESDFGNNRVYYDLKAIEDKDGNELATSFETHFELLERIDHFIWEFVSFDDTLFEDGFAFNLDTHELIIISN